MARPGAESETIRERQHEVETKADSYAASHPEGSQPSDSPGLIGRIKRRVGALIGRHNAS